MTKSLFARPHYWSWLILSGFMDSEVSDTVSKLREDVALFQRSLIATGIRLQEMIAAVDHDSLNV